MAARALFLEFSLLKISAENLRPPILIGFALPILALKEDVLGKKSV